jgi:hypothetical protein
MGQDPSADPTAPDAFSDPSDPFAQNTVIPKSTKPRQMPSGGGGPQIDPSTGQPMLDDPLADPSLDPMAEPDQTEDPAFPVNDGAEADPTNNFPPKSSVRRLAAYVRKNNPELNEVEVQLLAEAASYHVDTSNIIPPGMAPRLPAIQWGRMMGEGFGRIEQERQNYKTKQDFEMGIRPGQGADRSPDGKEKPGYFEDGRFKPWTVNDQVKNFRSGPYQPTVDSPHNVWGPPKGPRVRPEGDDIIDAEVVPNKTHAPTGPQPKGITPPPKEIGPADKANTERFLDPDPVDRPQKTPADESGSFGEVKPVPLQDTKLEDYPNQNNDVSHPDVEAPEQTHGGHPDADGRPEKPDKPRDNRGRPIIPPMDEIY